MDDIMNLYNTAPQKQPKPQEEEKTTKNDDFFADSKPSPSAQNESNIDDLFGDFRASQPVPENNKNNVEDDEINMQDKIEAMELISFKITMVFLEKVLVILKQNKLSEGKCLGQIGLEFGGVLDKNDGDQVILSADYTSVQEVWNNPQRLLKNANPKIKHNTDSGMGTKNNWVYNVNDFDTNVLLYEYQLNPKEINLIPLSIQYRTTVVDGWLKVKIFLHANPKLPNRLFDIELLTFFKEKDKLTLKQSNPHGIHSKESMTFNIAGMEPDQ